MSLLEVSISKRALEFLPLFSRLGALLSSTLRRPQAPCDREMAARVNMVKAQSHNIWLLVRLILFIIYLTIRSVLPILLAFMSQCLASFLANHQQREWESHDLS